MFGIFRNKLPDANELFKKFIAPWYPEEERPDLPRPDMFQLDVFEGEPLDLANLQYLNEESLEEVSELVNKTMLNAALGDFADISNVAAPTLELLAAVDSYYTKPRIIELVKASDPADFSNDYVIAVCEFGTLLGSLFLQQEGFGWLYSHPYFNSIIVHEKTGFAIPVYDWAVKKFSSYGVDDGFVDKFHAVVAGVHGEWADES